MNADPSIRRVNESAADLLADMHAACFSPAWDAASFRGLLTRPGCRAFLAPGEAPSAFAVVQLAADECEILTLGTLPQARRAGLARALLRAVLAEVSAAGAAAIFLEVAEDNHAAQCLYRELGFAETGRRRAYYRAPDGHLSDALTLRAALPPPVED